MAKEKIESGKWIKLCYYCTIDMQNAKWLLTRCRLLSNGSVHFRKMGVCKGWIENPEWSASPFDLVTNKDLYDKYSFDGTAIHQRSTIGENYVTMYTYTDETYKNGYFIRYTKPGSDRTKQIIIGTIVNGTESNAYQTAALT